MSQKLNRATNIIFDCSEFQVKHVVNLHRSTGEKETIGARSFPSNTFGYEYTSSNIHGIQFSMESYIVIERKRYQQNTNNKYVKDQKVEDERPSILITPLYMTYFQKCVCDVLGYFDHDKGGFNYDANGMPISRKKISNVAINTHNNQLIFRPALIVDSSSSISYEGVELHTSKGVLGSLTKDEYSAFYFYMNSALNNFYVSTISLANLASNLVSNQYMMKKLTKAPQKEVPNGQQQK